MTEKTTLVIGASERPGRYSRTAVKKLLSCDIPVIAIGLREGEIDGVRIHKQFPEVRDVHTVTLYVGRTNQSVYHDYIVRIHPVRVIFNPGTENTDFEQELKDLGINVVRACTLIMLDNGTY